MPTPTEENCEGKSASAAQHALRIPNGSLPRLATRRRATLQTSARLEHRQLKRGATAKSLSPLPAREADDVLRRAVSCTRSGAVAAALLAELVCTSEQQQQQQQHLSSCHAKKPSLLLDNVAREELSQQGSASKPCTERETALFSSADKLVQRSRQHLTL
jgi:hypothetical protein